MMGGRRDRTRRAVIGKNSKHRTNTTAFPLGRHFLFRICFRLFPSVTASLPRESSQSAYLYNHSVAAWSTEKSRDRIDRRTLGQGSIREYHWHEPEPRNSSRSTINVRDRHGYAGKRFIHLVLTTLQWREVRSFCKRGSSSGLLSIPITFHHDLSRLVLPPTSTHHPADSQPRRN
ncbi:hypothetical protein FA15DRAFT_283122 [Coprinopsis marcescibilis]|uniref:Uncharacterized protein n=1 Tax=Coprinopsis marcescibilis TaxID=230819 RepID=A0A5C3L9V9_COPMA|nr:hypothetical protein FA15DRAFT_283122 [Coprinopsis marcescibilis]